MADLLTRAADWAVMNPLGRAAVGTLVCVLILAWMCRWTMKTARWE